MLKDLKNNEKGVVFVTVLIIIVISMVLAVNILSMNISQVTSSEEELKMIQAGILKDGVLAQFYVNQFANSAANSFTYQETMGNTTFTVLANAILGSAPGQSNATPVSINIVF